MSIAKNQISFNHLPRDIYICIYGQYIYMGRDIYICIFELLGFQDLARCSMTNASLLRILHHNDFWLPQLYRCFPLMDTEIDRIKHLASQDAHHLSEAYKLFCKYITLDCCMCGTGYDANPYWGGGLKGWIFCTGCDVAVCKPYCQRPKSNSHGTQINRLR